MVINKRILEKAFTPRKRRSNNFRPSAISSKTTSYNIRVVVRVRPPNAKESGSRTLIKVVDDKILIFDPKEEANPFFVSGVKQRNRDMLRKEYKHLQYMFDSVFDHSSTNEDVFNGTTKDFITSLLDGYNCSVFVYGPTGAGKTYTMLGNKDNPGISYLTMVRLYEEIEKLKDERNFELGISYVEVYNEKVQDLINPSGALQLRDDGVNGTMVAGIQVLRISSAEELFAMLERGNRNRTQHPTDANAESSRSHAIFQVYLRITYKSNNQVKLSKLIMVDLAGSERGAATGCNGIRFTEGSSINKSLLALGNCVNALADGLNHIPYRNSKLTRLIKDTLGGNSKTVMIANVSPSTAAYDETYNTLNYAMRAKKINVKIKNNIVSVDMHVSQYIKMVDDLKAQNISLKRQLEEALEARKTPNSPTEHPPSTLTITLQAETSPELLEIWRKELRTIYDKKAAYHKDVLKMDMDSKVLRWRIDRKETVANRLAALCIKNEEVLQLRHKTARLRLEVESLQKKLELARNEQKVNHSTIVKKHSEMRAHGLGTELDSFLRQENCKIDLVDTKIQLEHSKKLTSMQQNEINGADKLINLLGTKYLQYYHMLSGYDKTTESMKTDMERIQHYLCGVKEVSWVDHPSESMKVTKLSLTNFESECGDLIKYSARVNKEDFDKRSLKIMDTEFPEEYIENATAADLTHNVVSLCSNGNFKHAEDSLSHSTQSHQYKINDISPIICRRSNNVFTLQDITFNENLDGHSIQTSQNTISNKEILSSTCADDMQLYKPLSSLTITDLPLNKTFSSSDDGDLLNKTYVHSPDDNQLFSKSFISSTDTDGQLLNKHLTSSTEIDDHLLNKPLTSSTEIDDRLLNKPLTRSAEIDVHLLKKPLISSAEIDDHLLKKPLISSADTDDHLLKKPLISSADTDDHLLKKPLISSADTDDHLLNKPLASSSDSNDKLLNNPIVSSADIDDQSLSKTACLLDAHNQSLNKTYVSSADVDDRLLNVTFVSPSYVDDKLLNKAFVVSPSGDVDRSLNKTYVSPSGDVDRSLNKTYVSLPDTNDQSLNKTYVSLPEVDSVPSRETLVGIPHGNCPPSEKVFFSVPVASLLPEKTSVDLIKSEVHLEELSVKELNSTFCLQGAEKVKFEHPIMDNKVNSGRILREWNLNKVPQANLHTKGTVKRVESLKRAESLKRSPNDFSRKKEEIIFRENKPAPRPSNLTKFSLLRFNNAAGHPSPAIRLPTPTRSQVPVPLHQGQRVSVAHHPYNRTPRTELSKLKRPR